MPTVDPMTGPADLAPLWDLAKNVFITLTFAGVAWIARTLRDMEKRQVNLEHIVIGVDGTNGLRSIVKKNELRIDNMDDRNIAADAVAAAERQQYEGEDKRHTARRLKDILNDKERNP
jgi:hypothetical protein